MLPKTETQRNPSKPTITNTSPLSHSIDTYICPCAPFISSPMDFNLNQWRVESEEQHHQQQQEEEGHETTHSSPSKHPKLHHSSQIQYSNSALPLFAPDSSTPTSLTRFPCSGMGSYFNSAQWQELELQALIFRHMISGANVPQELLHLVKKSLITSSPYYINPTHHPQYNPYYQPPLVQSGYWSKASMDPEPGRCRRTDGKKWRCSRDAVEGQKYCDRHVHRGKNRSRKPVEIPTSAAAVYGGDGGGGGGFRINDSATPFSLSGPSVDLLHLNPRLQSDVRRPFNSMVETKGPFEATNEGQTGGGQTLRHFFDDWSKSLHETDNASTSLTISTPANSSSDFSLKLGTGYGEQHGAQVSSGQRDGSQPNWVTTMGWETNRVAPMGGPLAEALRSSMSTSSSPKSVLHRLTRSSASETSYVSS